MLIDGIHSDNDAIFMAIDCDAVNVIICIPMKFSRICFFLFSSVLILFRFPHFTTSLYILCVTITMATAVATATTTNAYCTTCLFFHSKN